MDDLKILENIKAIKQDILATAKNIYSADVIEFEELQYLESLPMMLMSLLLIHRDNLNRRLSQAHQSL